MKLDVLVFAAHPDDAELSCSGTIFKLVSQGKKVGIIDFTKGELGTRGTPELRIKEAEKSSKILNLSIRENLGFSDGFFEESNKNILKIVSKIRQYKPEIIFANAKEDRHPDHGKGGRMVEKAYFMSGLRKIEDQHEAYRPQKLYHYIQDRFIEPDFVVDISEFWETKLESIKAFDSQFFDPNSKEPSSYISSEKYFKFIEARGREMGHFINKDFGEGFTSYNPIEFDVL